jgi:hypothetical protein
MLKGTLVSATGAEPSGRIDVAPFETTGLQDSELSVMGMVTADISNGVNGTVVSFGTLKGVDTRGNYSSALAVGDETWAEGDILYAHPTVPGKLTRERPKHDLAVAFITVRHASSGQIAVRIVPGNFHLEWLHDVALDTPTSGQVLQFDGTDWINANLIGLPSQTGNTGKYLTTDGTDASWADVVLADGSVTETKIADGAVTNAKIDGVDASKVSGTTLVVDRLRGVSTGGMSLTSSTHGLQVGPTDGGNLAFDGNDIQARSDGAAGDISINRLGGDVDIGNTTTGFGIEGTKVWANGVYGNILTTSFRSVYVSSTDTRDKLGYVSSSRETKKNIEPLAYTVEQILSIEPFQYNYNAEEDGQPKHAGFIAEDLHDAGLTGFVSYDGGKPATVNYEFYVVALQKALREQHTMIVELREEIEKLKADKIQ